MTAPRSRFFMWASLVILAGVVFAFGPTYYFRSFSGRPDISGSADLPWHLYVHGATLTAWFLLPVLQTALVAAGRTDLHRRVGIAGAVLAAVVIVTSVLTVLRSVPRLKATTIAPLFSDAQITDLVIGDLVMAGVFFPFMVAVGILRRNTPEVHRRWMFLSAAVMTGPVIGRFIGVWELPVLAIAFAPLTWSVALAIFDVRSMRRIHPATMWATGVGLGGLLLANLLARTSAAHALMLNLALAIT